LVGDDDYVDEMNAKDARNSFNSREREREYVCNLILKEELSFILTKTFWMGRSDGARSGCNPFEYCNQISRMSTSKIVMVIIIAKRGIGLSRKDRTRLINLLIIKSTIIFSRLMESDERAEAM
jgi:hypothetical protein